MSADLVTGYHMVAAYHRQSFDDDKQLLAQIYETLALTIEAGDIDELAESYRNLDFKDSLELILEALE